MYIGLFARLCNPILLLSKSLQQPATATPSPFAIRPQWNFFHLYFLFTKYKALKALYGWSRRTFQINYSSHTAQSSPRVQGCGLVCCELIQCQSTLTIPFIGKSSKIKYEFFASRHPSPSLRTAGIGANENTPLASVL